MGRYYWGLVRDQLTPNDELRQTPSSRRSTGVDRKDDPAVVRAIYDFVVTNTRYVALEFGIHGYKPYRVDRVLARRFGDCKDKASLMHAMLEGGGRGQPAWCCCACASWARMPREPASLAAFNHAIVYVPTLDCTWTAPPSSTARRELPIADRRGQRARRRARREEPLHRHSRGPARGQRHRRCSSTSRSARTARPR